MAKLAVSFSPHLVVHEALHIDDFDDYEIDACWYCEEEYRAMSKDIQQTRNHVRNHIFIDEKTRSRRGVEEKSTFKSLQPARQAIRAVLREQEAQLMRDQKINDKRISLVYGQYTRNSEFEAYLTGAADADEVHKPASRKLTEMYFKRKNVDSPPSSPRSRIRKLKQKPRLFSPMSPQQRRPRLPAALFSLKK